MALNATKRDSQMVTRNRRRTLSLAQLRLKSTVVFTCRAAGNFPELLPVDFISFMCLSVGMKSCSKANKEGDRSVADRGQSKYISNSCLFL